MKLLIGYFTMLLCTSIALASVEARITQGHLVKEVWILESKIIKNTNRNLFTLHTNGKTLSRVVPPKYFQKVLNQIPSWKKQLSKKTPFLGNACSDSVDIEYKNEMDSFCFSYLDKKTQSQFNKWYTESQRGY